MKALTYIKATGLREDVKSNSHRGTTKKGKSKKYSKTCYLQCLGGTATCETQTMHHWRFFDETVWIKRRIVKSVYRCQGFTQFLEAKNLPRYLEITHNQTCRFIHDTNVADLCVESHKCMYMTNTIRKSSLTNSHMICWKRKEWRLEK